MPSSIVVDTYAWVEYLIGSRAGMRARKFIDEGRSLTPSIVLAELRKWYLRETEAGRRSEREMQSHFAFIELATQIIPLDASLALKAGELDFLMKKRIKGWPLADSIVYATAKSHLAQVISGDPHFEALDDVIFIG
ncbi:MAG: type II toxin-antitoxin system VapC family toxin [Thaumarchaeota archaeon]|nr:type II toxin-antitoxin system VapC family toxin [Nitrososphaerota archaeon]